MRTLQEHIEWAIFRGIDPEWAPDDDPYSWGEVPLVAWEDQFTSRAKLREVFADPAIGEEDDQAIIQRQAQLVKAAHDFIDKTGVIEALRACKTISDVKEAMYDFYEKIPAKSDCVGDQRATAILARVAFERMHLYFQSVYPEYKKWADACEESVQAHEGAAPDNKVA